MKGHMSAQNIWGKRNEPQALPFTLVFIPGEEEKKSRPTEMPRFIGGNISTQRPIERRDRHPH
ncbi:hypothetical protein I7I48_02396 [Histoplasma ohiense]|nr:hypothetical protein I7I48_02396 [Histoplasma ohiense (nom. inval.)]